jgi:predicted  nucleic acid-binding Zn-ribbon protein
MKKNQKPQLSPQTATAFKNSLQKEAAKQRQLLADLEKEHEDIDEDILELSSQIEQLTKNLIDITLDMRNAGLPVDQRLKQLSKPRRIPS